MRLGNLYTRGLLLLIVAAMVISFTGCAPSVDIAKVGSTVPPKASPTAAPEATAQTTEAPVATQEVAEQPLELEKLDTLKVPASDWTYIAQQEGWFEEVFGKQGIKVEVVEGTIGNEAQLIERGDLHFAGRMLYPYLLYRAAGADLTAVQVSAHAIPEVASIVVLGDSPYQSFDDLKDKKIATWRAGCPYMVLTELTEDRNWEEGKDWNFVNIKSSEFKTALLSGEIAAVSTHPSDDLAIMLLNGSAREIAHPAQESAYIQGGGATVIFTSNKFAQNYPNITKTYAELQDTVQRWIIENQDDAAAIVKEVTRVPEDVTKQGWARRATGNWAYSEKDLKKIKTETQRTVDWLVEHGDLEAGKIDVENLFTEAFFDN